MMKILTTAAIWLIALWWGSTTANAQAVVATQPSIMVLPSDALLNRIGCLDRVEVNGIARTIQNYEKAFIEDGELRLAISQIQERFAEVGFPLKDLEFALRSINTQETFDNVDNIDLDLKSILLKNAQPDIYLDLDYFQTGSGLTSGLSFNIRAIDAYTNKAIATASNSGISTVNNNLADNLVEQVEMNLQNLQSSMRTHFEDLNLNGRMVSLRISVERNSPINDFRRDRCGNEPYTRTFVNYIKRNTVHGGYHLQSNSAKEVYYDVIRIPLFDNDGFPMGASDWAYEMTMYLEENCGLITIDNTTKLGEAHIIVIAN